MRPAEVLSFREFRAGLSATLKRVQSGGPVFVGSHRRAQAVVLSMERYTELLDAAERREAVTEALASVRAEGLEPSPRARQLLAAVAADGLGEEQAIEQLRRHYRG